MFGWLAARSPSLCRRASRSHASRRVRRITPHALIGLLPGLGSVLYLHAASRGEKLTALPPGLLMGHPALVPLLEVQWLVVVSAITNDGPREWCECVDRFGRIRARWHLLPDTDYLAWDALTASCEAACDGSPIVDTQPLRPDHASVVNFHLREWAGLWVLEHALATPLSPLGHQVAATIAQIESAMLRV
ncbi:MAG TPA: hypothetical protein VL997_08515 [Dyella sp.]|nr:hypothetical protein [Dyella sp.]